MTDSKHRSLRTSTQLSKAQQPFVWQLLQSTSREPDSPFPIQREYPIVLGDAMAEASVCLAKAPFTTSADLVCHTSFWPRQMVGSGSAFTVGLIGNVATHPDWRKQGLMTRLLGEVAERAQEQGLSALILWSDLVALYAKLGFVATSKEVRYIFHRERLLAELTMAEISQGYQLKAIRPAELSDEDLKRCLTLRPKVPFTLQRTVTEFRQLLTIPNLFIFAQRDSLTNELNSFYLVEKGADMPQVVHEWGMNLALVDAPRRLAAELLVISEALGYDQLLLLAPAQLDATLVKGCQHFAIGEETHPMALVKMLRPGRPIRRALAEAFVWGLDGI